MHTFMSAWTLRQAFRLSGLPAGEPGQIIRAWTGRLGSLQLSLRGWMMVAALALANWLADAAVLAVSIHATGATVPWHDLLLVYGSGIAAQSLNITPGGLGVTEATLSVALVGAGMSAGPALAAVLLYRLASFWLVALTGWLVLFWLRRPRARPGAGHKPAGRVAQDEETAAAGDAETDRHAAEPGPHELVLLHGQPGSPADWQQVATRLPGPASRGRTRPAGIWLQPASSRRLRRGRPRRTR